MTLAINCPRCKTAIDAVDEDDLVAKVQAHVRDDHGLNHTLPPKHIRRSGSLGGEFSSWEVDGDAGAAEVDEGDEGVG